MGEYICYGSVSEKKLKEKNGKASMNVILTGHLYFVRFPI